MKSAEGKLLIAIPDLPDPNFFRTVVFVIEHNENGAMGVVLNRPSEVKLEQLWAKLEPNVAVARYETIHIGGPVHGPIIALHDQIKFADKVVVDGVAVTMAGERINELVSSKNHHLKLFNGYSGWGAEQLDSEIEVGGWLVTNSTASDVFGSADQLWKSVSERFGNQIMLQMPNATTAKPNFGGDPNLN